MNKLIESLSDESLFLLGPRQTGKTTWLRSALPNALHFNLLDTQLHHSLATQPHLFLEQVTFALRRKESSIIVVDEIQKAPILLDAIHELLFSHPGLRFLLSGSSARKLRHQGVNLLGGRAGRQSFHPLTTREAGSWPEHRRSWQDLLVWGGLPPVLSSQSPRKKLGAYVDLYLKEEIAAEGLVRRLPDFASFLRTAASTSGQQIIFEKVASDCGIPGKTLRSWYDVLEDTMLGELLPSFQETTLRKPMSAARFFFFDVGVANFLKGTLDIKPGSAGWSDAFEHLIYMEIRAYLSYFRPDLHLMFWRTHSKIEVDFIICNDKMEPILACEVKGKIKIDHGDFRGLKAFAEEFPNVRKVVVAAGGIGRVLDNGMEVWPIDLFLEELNNGKMV